MPKAIITKYHGPSARRGSYILATDSDGHRVQWPIDNAYSVREQHLEAARLLAHRHWKCRPHFFGGELPKGLGMAWVPAPEPIVTDHPAQPVYIDPLGGKAVRVTAICYGEDQANDYCLMHPGSSVLGEYAPLVFIANHDDRGVKLKGE